jgi:hypothetical protein
MFLRQLLPVLQYKKPCASRAYLYCRYSESGIVTDLLRSNGLQTLVDFPNSYVHEGPAQVKLTVHTVKCTVYIQGSLIEIQTQPY